MGQKKPSIEKSGRVVRLLELFLQTPQACLSGAEIQQRCGIAAGSLYPILIRLESAGWFASQWESRDPSRAALARRRLYRLTSTGLREASGVFVSFNRGVFA